MVEKEIPVEILEIKPEGLKVKLPFLEVPVTMDFSFFKKRLASGYFIIVNSEIIPQLNQFF